jgi:hypothetical protein
MQNIRLGGRNLFEDAISDLAIQLEEDGAQNYYNAAADTYGEPYFKYEFNDDEGFVINVLEQ